MIGLQDLIKILKACLLAVSMIQAIYLKKQLILWVKQKDAESSVK